jgi:CubicO group peptidase (beta-lactamase class C family)
LLAVACALSAAAAPAAKEPTVAQRLAGFDAYMETLVRDWNVPGIGVAVVAKDQVVLAEGWGFRDCGKKLPFTPQTVVPIASNTKLFSALAAGMLVEEGKLAWDAPVKQFVPQIRFYNDQLDATVSIRDMLGHRTGITRHDAIWYNSDFTRKELSSACRTSSPRSPSGSSSSTTT